MFFTFRGKIVAGKVASLNSVDSPTEGQSRLDPGVFSSTFSGRRTAATRKPVIAVSRRRLRSPAGDDAGERRRRAHAALCAEAGIPISRRSPCRGRLCSPPPPPRRFPRGDGPPRKPRCQGAFRPAGRRRLVGESGAASLAAFAPEGANASFASREPRPECAALVSARGLWRYGRKSRRPVDRPDETGRGGAPSAAS